MRLNLYSKTGRKSGKGVNVDDSVFKAPVNEDLMSLAVYTYLNNKRQVNAHVKTRGEVRGGGAKPWRQKGTGRARHGSIRSPIWKGGGVTFGPRNTRNYNKKMTKKMKKNAIRSAFSQHVKSKTLLIMENVELQKDHLTKQVVEMSKKLPLEGRKLYIQKGDNRMLFLGSRNVKDIAVINVSGINVYTLLKYDNIIIIENALADISKNWSGKKSKMEKVPEEKAKEEIKKKKTTKKKRKTIALEKLKLPTRVLNSLKKARVTNITQLRRKIEKGSKIKGLGEKSIEDIKKKLKI